MQLAKGDKKKAAAGGGAKDKGAGKKDKEEDKGADSHSSVLDEVDDLLASCG